MASKVGDAGGTMAGRLSPASLFTSAAIPGVVLCAAIAMPAFELSRYSSSLDALTLSLILGMILRNVLGPGEMIRPGIALVSVIFVPAGIMLYGTRLDFATFANLPVLTLAAVTACVIMFYTVILLGSRRLGIDSRTGLLIASGTAICGASAIAVLSPVVGARSRETSMALIVTTTAGLMGVFLYPLLADAFSLTPLSYGIFCGSTLQQLGVVKLAASNLGDAAVALAVPVKMVRIALLAPIAIMMAATTAVWDSGSLKKSGGGYDGADSEARAEMSSHAAFSHALRRCWFLPVFIAIAIIFSFFGPAGELRQQLEPLATIVLAMALASIGLSVDFGSIKAGGSRPLLVGVLGWALVAFIFLLALAPLLAWGQ